jgi:hypothetical protein
MEELKPCPFCGNSKSTFQGRSSYLRHKEDCYLYNTKVGFSEWGIWNTRAIDPLLDEMARALEELEGDFDETSRIGEIIANALQKYREQNNG